ncbi:hypothetical protein P8935_03740 [Telmatobacter sp. DSM 110680]|uniref:Uncharacterized protein n=1 Tax=Telmatobacter sp. DSM 110680 TaxID=3036704 RepID=A0AAU7DN03_9BACT
MKSRNCSLMSAMVVLVLACAMVPGALAQCGLNKKYVKPAAWHPQIGTAHFMHAALFNDDDDNSPSIVGMWHVIFTAHTVNGNPIPSNAYPMIDNAFVVVHSDKTEIMESARPPQDGNFCLGVWEKTGPRSYFINHLPWLGNDTANAPSGIGNPTGGAQITEHLTLNEEGDKYAGSFTLVAYNLDGTKAVTFTGVIAATRITTSTSLPGLL